jgi:predicted transcriptional regulator
METINKRISHLIVQLKMTPYEFSKKMGNSRPDTLYNLLNNE